VTLGRDPGLTIRMVLALVLTALTLVGVVATLIWIAREVHYMLAGFAVVFGLLGLAAGGEPKTSKKNRRPLPRDGERLERVIGRLSMMAEVAPPAVVAEPQRAPLCWTTTTLFGRPSIHATTGLLDQLDDEQLSAVIAHELSHVVNKDALVMTLVAGFPTLFFRAWEEDDNPFAVVLWFFWLLPALFLTMGFSRMVSRHRELIADRGAALLTGSPAAVAGALMTLSGGLSAMRDQDLRSAAPNDIFHFLPVKVETSGKGRLWATHPPLADRLARLDRMERELQG
jgi:heat shock protein HtpX